MSPLSRGRDDRVAVSPTLPHPHPSPDGVQTCSAAEWLYLCEDEATPEQLDMERWPYETVEKLPDRSKCRRRRPLDDILHAAAPRNQELEKADQPPLVKAEIVAANLYTGPVRAR